MPQLTPRQRAYVRKRTKVHDPDPSELDGELNIVPFLDIVVNLIIFLLATTVAVLQVAEIDAQLPSLGRSSRRAGDMNTSLNLSVTITNAGIIVSGSGGHIGPGCQGAQQAGERIITVPKRSGEHNWSELETCAQRIKTQFPDEDRVILTADPAVEYGNLIEAMDALRGDAENELFPNVMLSAGIR